MQCCGLASQYLDPAEVALLLRVVLITTLATAITKMYRNVLNRGNDPCPGIVHATLGASHDIATEHMLEIW